MSCKRISKKQLHDKKMTVLILNLEQRKRKAVASKIVRMFVQNKKNEM